MISDQTGIRHNGIEPALARVRSVARPLAFAAEGARARAKADLGDFSASLALTLGPQHQLWLLSD